MLFPLPFQNTVIGNVYVEMHLLQLHTILLGAVTNYAIKWILSRDISRGIYCIELCIRFCIVLSDGRAEAIDHIDSWSKGEIIY